MRSFTPLYNLGVASSSSVRVHFGVCLQLSLVNDDQLATRGRLARDCGLCSLQQELDLAISLEPSDLLSTCKGMRKGQRRPDNCCSRHTPLHTHLRMDVDQGDTGVVLIAGMLAVLLVVKPGF